MAARKTTVFLVGYLLIGWLVRIFVNFVEKTVLALCCGHFSRPRSDHLPCLSHTLTHSSFWNCARFIHSLYLSGLPIVCVGCQSCQQLISAAKALNKVTRLKTCVLPMAMTMFMYILCEGLVEPKQILFFSCCPSSHCQPLQYNQMKKEMPQYPAQNSDSTNLFDILAQRQPPRPRQGGPAGLQHQAVRTVPGLEDGTFLVYDQL